MELSSLLTEIAQTLIEGVALEDDSGYLVFVNRALEQLLGYGPGELVGQPRRVLVHAPLCERAEGSDSSIACYEMRLRRKDGGIIPVSVTTCRLPLGDRRRGRLSVFSDLRERRCSETRSRRSEELALRSQLLASVAHELNNPLTIVALQSQLLSKADPAIPGFREHLEIIQDQIGRMKRIIEQLCISSDSNGLRLETIDINALVRRALELQEHQLRQVEAQVAMDLAQDLPDIQVDPHRLQQVFVNLITNACQALTTTAPPRRLWVATTLVSEGRGRALGVQIRFTDNGPGISPEIMPHLFEPFFTTKKPGQGMGLGLSICDGIVREHGGRIWAQQKESSGATFVIELPAIRRAEDRQGSPLVPSRRRPVEQQAVPCIPEERAHILVVDDEPEMVHAAEQLLRQEGFEVTTAIEVQQALALLEQVRIDLVISDLAMPRIDGSRFYQIVTSRYPHLANRIIFSTGDSGSQRLGAFLRECGCAWIDKPFQPDELFSLIHRALRKGGASVVAQDKQ